MRRRHPRVVERQDLRGDERAVVAIGDRQDAENRQDEVKRAHSGAECIRTMATGTPIARGPRTAKDSSCGVIVSCRYANALPSLCSKASRFSWRCSILPAPAALRAGRLLRPEQGPVPGLRVQGAEDRTLRHLLLPGGGGRGADDGRLAERWYTRLSQMLNHSSRPSADHPLRQRAALPADDGDRRGAGGGDRRRHRGVQAADRPAARRPDSRRPITCSATSSSTRSSTTSPTPTSAPGNGGALNLPLWFIEGMAEYLSIGPVDAHTAMWMREAARREKLPDIDELDDPRYFPYRYGHALWAYIGGRYGDEVIGDMLRAAARRARATPRRSRASSASTRRSSRRSGTTRSSRPTGRSPSPPRCRGRWRAR